MSGDAKISEYWGEPDIFYVLYIRIMSLILTTKSHIPNIVIFLYSNDPLFIL